MRFPGATISVKASYTLRLDDGGFDRVVLEELLYGQLIHFPAVRQGQ